MPLIGYLVIFNDHLVAYLNLSSAVTGVPTQPAGLSQGATLRLICIYFGLTFLGVGSVLFAIFCPPIIKEHESAQSFVRDELDLLTPSAIRKYVQNYTEIKGEVEFPFERIGNEIGRLNEFIRNPDSEVSLLNLRTISELEARARIKDLRDTRRTAATNLLRELFTVTSHSKGRTAMNVLCCFAAGLLFLSLPAFWLFWQVSATFVRILANSL